MRKRILVMSLAAAALSLIGMASVALADPTSSHSGGAYANQIGVVRIDPNDPTAAYVTGRYNCPAGADAHLFVSVKQVAGGKPDPALKLEGSSSISAAWLENHPDSSTWTCDGTWHINTWRISSTPGDPDTDYPAIPPGRPGALVPGQVYVQFCWDDNSGNNAWHAYSEQFARAAY